MLGTKEATEDTNVACVAAVWALTLLCWVLEAEPREMLRVDEYEPGERIARRVTEGWGAGGTETMGARGDTESGWRWRQPANTGPGLSTSYLEDILPGETETEAAVSRDSCVRKIGETCWSTKKF